jgi:hypothetical protein
VRAAVRKQPAVISEVFVAYFDVFVDFSPGDRCNFYVDVLHTIFKRRLDDHGVPKAAAERDDNIHSNKSMVRAHVKQVLEQDFSVKKTARKYRRGA